MKRNVLLPLGMMSVLVSGLLLRPERAAAAPTVSSVSAVMKVDANHVPVGNPLGSSQLVRDDTGLTLIAMTTTLTPLNAYTVWWEIISPANETVFVANASGVIALPDGTASFVIRLPVGPLPAVNGTTVMVSEAGAMFTDTRGVKVIAWIRDHGPVVLAQLADQLRLFDGGCPTNTCATAQNTVHAP